MNTITEDDRRKRKTGLARLLQIAGTKKWWLLASMTLAVASAAAQFLPFISIYHILAELARNAAAPEHVSKTLVWHWAYIALAGSLLYGALLYASTMLSHIAAFNILYELRMRLALKLARLPLGYFTRRNSGQIKKIMSEDVERIELFVAHHIPDITAAVVFPLLLIGYMLYTDWRLTAVVGVVFAGAIAFQASMVLGGRREEMYKKYQQAMGRMNGSIVEYIRGIQVIKVFSRSTDSFVKLNCDIDTYRDMCIQITRRYAPVYLGYYTALSSTLLLLIPAAVCLLLLAPSYPAYAPKALMFLILGGGIFFPMMKLMWMGSLMMQNTSGVSLVDEILEKDEIAEIKTPKEPENASIEFRNVTFSYEKHDVLRNISFTARPGTVTALVGPSGSGKTTIAMLCARFWDVQGGEILVGGVPVRNIAVSRLMEHISFVFQDNMLFFDTIEENIRMGNKTASLDEVKAAAGIAQCHEFIGKLEHGYGTMVGEGGTYLSGGEQQRIALARAILKNSPIVLLDEATAYADPENEGKILDALSQLIKNKTVIVIAHRLSTITDADQILAMDGGTIAERGRHAELLEANGLYRRMWNAYSMSREWTLSSGKKAPGIPLCRGGERK